MDIESNDISLCVDPPAEGLTRFETVLAVVLVAVYIFSVAGIYFIRKCPQNGLEGIYITPSELPDLSVINSASKDDFMAVKGIGKVKAEQIINLRDSLGGFTDIRSILYIDGISENLLNEIIHYFYGEEYTYSDDRIILSQDSFS